MEISANGGGIQAVWRYDQKIVVFRPYGDMIRKLWYSGHMEISSENGGIQAIWRYHQKMVVFGPYRDIKKWW
jgi:hypothetical protein